jgi:hypothetical protein
MKNWTFNLLTIQKDKDAGTGIGIGLVETSDNILQPKLGGFLVVVKTSNRWIFDFLYVSLWGVK